VALTDITTSGFFVNHISLSQSLLLLLFIASDMKLNIKATKKTAKIPGKQASQYAIQAKIPGKVSLVSGR